MRPFVRKTHRHLTQCTWYLLCEGEFKGSRRDAAHPSGLTPYTHHVKLKTCQVRFVKQETGLSGRGFTGRRRQSTPQTRPADSALPDRRPDKRSHSQTKAQYLHPSGLGSSRCRGTTVARHREQMIVKPAALVSASCLLRREVPRYPLAYSKKIDV